MGTLKVNGDIIGFSSTESNVGVMHGDSKFLYLWGRSDSGTRGIYDSAKGYVISVSDGGASFYGNASTASKLLTARTISLTGSVTGSGTFDGSGNLSIATTTNHTHSYLPLSGGTLTGHLILSAGANLLMTYSGANYRIIENYNNGNITIGSAGGSLHLAYNDTTILYFGPQDTWGSMKSNGLDIFGYIYTNAEISAGTNLAISSSAGNGYGISLYAGPNYVQQYGIMFAKTSNFGGNGAVTGDWATYFTMDGNIDRGWIFRHINTNVASISSSGIICGTAFTNGSTVHLYPGGGSYICNTPSITGYLKITLPVTWTNTMFRFDINIYDYSGNDAVTYTVGGYNYSPTPGWYNISAESRGFGAHSNLPVTFGYDGSKCAIYVGYSSTTWSYPQVSISNVLTGYSNYSATWSGSWSVGFTTSSASYAQTIYNPNVTARTVNYGSSLPSSGYHAGAIFYKT